MGIIGKTLRLIGGLALGAGVGAAAAMLLAPQSGEMSKEQLQARVDEVLTAGRRASRARESELYAAWEAEMGDDAGSSTAKGAPKAAVDEDELAKQREKARAAATKAEDEAREKARKELEQAQEEAQKHLDKARTELEKADKAEKS